jgi:hypothetical protein
MFRQVPYQLSDGAARLESAYQRMREVAEDAGKFQAALDNIPSWQDHVTLDARSRGLQLDWRTVEPELLEWAKAVEAQAPRVPGGNVPR